MSIKHPCTTIDYNAVTARDIARGIIGKGCDYADGRKNGVRYKWLFRRYSTIPLGMLKNQIEDAFSASGIKNYRVVLHANKWNVDAISVTVHAV